MTNMTIEQLYDYLNSPDFQKADGNIFYNYYIYQYPASKEYLMRQQIVDFKEKLERPTTYINAMILDLFQVFCDYLSEEKFGDRSLLEDTLEEDQAHPNMVTTELTTEANSDNFIHYVNERIKAHITQNDGLNHPYVFVHGIGKMFPYLRTNVFLTRYEKYNDTSLYKIILFYPGHQEGNSFSLFDTLPDSHTYRAILLVNK
ncbi:BREX protein BrxB domain-containing protein [Bacteroides pyogenes]|uniref:BREX protein BrxB domain-containing protein n=1 Tax=Bacteroides pyogenes TaxID=310300 RepID=UPI002FDA81ED